MDAIDNYLSVKLENDSVFNLGTLLDFEISAADSWNGGTVRGNFLTFQQKEVRYSYPTNYAGNNPKIPAVLEFVLVNEDFKTPDPIEPEKSDTVKMPVFTPAGGEVEKGVTVTISCATANATIYYTTNGSAPTVQSAVYTAPIVINEAMTIKAMAVRENYVNSEVATASFTIKPIDPIDPEKPDTVKMPVFTPAGGEVEKGATVTISCATSNATIYYTTNGSAPTVQSAVYSAPIVINEAMTIKAMAVRENYVNSEVATATFTVATVANETEQTSSLVVYAQDRTICLSEEAGEVSVYTMDGRRVFCGKAVRIPVSAGGLYIVHVACRSYKLPVK